MKNITPSGSQDVLLFEKMNTNVLYIMTKQVQEGT